MDHILLEGDVAAAFEVMRRFDLVESTPTDADALMAAVLGLPLAAQDLYIMTRIRRHHMPRLYDPATNSSPFSLEHCVRVTLGVDERLAASLAHGLRERSWANDEATPTSKVRLTRSNNLTRLLVAVIIYQEGGAVRYADENHRKPSPRPRTDA